MTLTPRRAAMMLVASGLAISAAIAAVAPIEPIMPVYLTMADQLRGGLATSGFEPISYAAILAIGHAPIATTLRIAHLIALWTTWGVAWLLVRRAPLTWRSVGWLAVLLLHPYFLIGLIRVSDSAIDIALMAILVWAILRANRSTWTAWVVGGVALGVFATLRPNALSLLAAFAYAAWSARALTRFALVLSLTAATIVFTHAVTIGQPFFWPRTGPYNLFAGNNPASWSELASNYNAEYSLDQGLAWCGVTGDRYAVDGSSLVRCAARFVVEHPLEAIALAGYKTYTLLLRPNLRLAIGVPKIVLQCLLIVPPLLWWAWFATNATFRRSWPGRAGATIVVAYALPFVLTNADPRFRIPIDVIYALSAIAYLASAFGCRTEHARAAASGGARAR